MLSRPISENIFKDLLKTIPGGANSPVRACKSMNQLPMIVDFGFGDTLTDVDGHSYIDYCGSWGALIHGHAHPSIVNAVTHRMSRGTSFGISTAIEAKLAAEVIRQVPSIEKIRFVSSGTEATMSAARLARGFTGRDMIIKFSGHYHGHADFFLVQAGSGLIEHCQSASSAGIPQAIVQNTLNLPYNDRAACQTIFDHPQYKDKIAAVILEPIAGNMGVVPTDPDFMAFLRRETTRIGALLIFDEVITGFRVAKGGAQAFYGITPDLTCLGKIVGGGFPAAAFGGKASIMDKLAPDGHVYQAGTLSGNPVAMEAGLQNLKLLDEPNFYEKLAEKTEFLLKPIRDCIAEKNLNVCLQSVGSMFTLVFGCKQVNNFDQALKADTALYASFFRYLFSKGIYFPPMQHEACFVSSVHTKENLKKTAEAVTEFLTLLN